MYIYTCKRSNLCTYLPPGLLSSQSSSCTPETVPISGIMQRRYQKKGTKVHIYIYIYIYIHVHVHVHVHNVHVNRACVHTCICISV